MMERLGNIIRTVAAAVLLCSVLPARSGTVVCGHDGGEVIEEAALPRPVTGLYTLEIGGKRVHSSFLAPVAYSGTQYALSGAWSKAMPFAPGRAMMHFGGRVSGAWSLLNPRHNSSMQGIEVRFDWNLRAWWCLPGGFSFSAGAGPRLEAGVLALLKNSNNPANVDISAAVAASGSASWTHTFGRLPAVLSLEASLPVAGAFFMPGYGETYFEIYVGNRSGLVHFGWPGNRTALDLHFGIMLDFGRTAMEVGWRMEASRASANNLVLKSVSNMCTVSVVPGGLGLKKKVPQIRPL